MLKKKAERVGIEQCKYRSNGSHSKQSVFSNQHLYQWE